MIKILVSAFLMARLACQQLDVDWELCLRLWRSQPVIEVVLEHPGAKPLVERLDEVLLV